MKAIKHDITLQMQPTPTTCTQTALSMLIEHYGQKISPLDLEKEVPQVKDDEGNDGGTLIHETAAWCALQGYDVTLYAFDCLVLDQTWATKSASEITDKLERCLDEGPVVKCLGNDWTVAYRQGYIDLLKSDANLIIQPALTSKLLYELLEKGPVFVVVCSNILYGKGKGKNGNPDDVNGRAWNHCIVLYGNDENGNFLIADPIDGHQVVEPERMIAANSAAQMECDNMLYQISKVK